MVSWGWCRHGTAVAVLCFRSPCGYMNQVWQGWRSIGGPTSPSNHHIIIQRLPRFSGPVGYFLFFRWSMGSRGDVGPSMLSQGYRSYGGCMGQVWQGCHSNGGPSSPSTPLMGISTPLVGAECSLEQVIHIYLCYLKVTSVLVDAYVRFDIVTKVLVAQYHFHFHHTLHNQLTQDLGLNSGFPLPIMW